MIQIDSYSGVFLALRKRSAILEALERLRGVNPSFTLGQIMALLYIADEDGPLPLSDLRRRLDVSPNLAWRIIEALRTAEGPAALVESTAWGGRKRGALRLTASGKQLVALLDAAILDAQPIKVKPAGPKGPAGADIGLSATS